MNDISEGLEVKRTSWHYRLYQYWKRMGGQNSWGYKENLCHYCRVVGLWAPKRWFFHAKFWGFLSPWSLILILAALALLGIAIWLWPGTVANLGIIVGSLIAAIAIMVGVVLLWDFLKDHLGFFEAVDDWFHYHGETIGNIILLIFAGAMCLIILAFIGYGIYKHFIPAMIVVGCLAVLAGIIIGWALALRAWRKSHPKKIFRKEKPDRQPRFAATKELISKKTEGIREGAELAVKYLVAKKRRICPYITFVD
jgi:hypothetical protein